MYMRVCLCVCIYILYIIYINKIVKIKNIIYNNLYSK